MPRVKVISGSESNGVGPIRAVLEAQGPALALLEQAEGASGSNDVIREALQAGGDLWVNVFLPMRFTEYAKRLGYVVQPGWAMRKQKLTGQALPLVYTGNMREAAMQGAHADATAKKGGGTITIRIPIQHGGGGRQGGSLQPKDQAVLRRIPDWEVTRVGEEVERTLISLLNLRGLNLQTRAPVLTGGARQAPHVPTRKSA